MRGGSHEFESSERPEPALALEIHIQYCPYKNTHLSELSSAITSQIVFGASEDFRKQGGFILPPYRYKTMYLSASIL